MSVTFVTLLMTVLYKIEGLLFPGMLQSLIDLGHFIWTYFSKLVSRIKFLAEGVRKDDEPI